MPDLSTVDADELRMRMASILAEIDTTLKEIGPKMKKVGLLRIEAADIYDELEHRGLVEGRPDGGQVRKP